ncbi:MAG: transporter [Bacteroidales bacterium]
MEKYLMVVVIFFSANCNLWGQNLVPIQLDRPDQTECPFIVPEKHIQFESGFNFENVNSSEQNFLYPALLTKYGVNDRFEIRLITELTTNKIENEVLNGLKPVRIGFKTKLLEENGILPTMSFIAHLSLPFLSSEKFTTTYYAPSFRFTMQHTLSEKISLGYNLGAEWDGESAEPTFIYTLTTGFSLSERMGTYIEIYGYVPQKEKSDHRLDGGFTFLARQNIMIDISGGMGLTENAPDYYVSLGFSLRLPD